MSNIQHLSEQITKLTVGELRELTKQLTDQSQKELLTALTMTQSTSVSSYSVSLAYVDWSKYADGSFHQALNAMDGNERRELFEKIYINESAGQVEFPGLNLAIPLNVLNTRMTRSEAEDALKQMGNSWRMPKDFSPSSEDEMYVLDPERSDIDKIILHMPGKDVQAKSHNFNWVMGFIVNLDGLYWVGDELIARQLGPQNAAMYIERFKIKKSTNPAGLCPVKDLK